MPLYCRVPGFIAENLPDLTEHQRLSAQEGDEVVVAFEESYRDFLIPALQDQPLLSLPPRPMNSLEWKTLSPDSTYDHIIGTILHFATICISPKHLKEISPDAPNLWTFGFPSELCNTQFLNAPSKILTTSSPKAFWDQHHNDDAYIFFDMESFQALNAWLEPANHRIPLERVTFLKDRLDLGFENVPDTFSGFATQSVLQLNINPQMTPSENALEWMANMFSFQLGVEYQRKLFCV